LKKKITRILFIASAVISAIVLIDNFLLWKIKTPEVLVNYADPHDQSGDFDRTCRFTAQSRRVYYVPYYLYCGVNEGDTFWVKQTPIFRHGVSIIHTFKGVTYTDNVRMLNFPSRPFGIFTFMLIMLVFDFFYPQFNDDTLVQLHLSMAIFATTLFGVYGYVFM